MNRWLHVLSTALVLCSTVALFGACNIFDATNDAEKPMYDQAEEFIREGNYAGAREVLADAVADSTDAMALYLNSKIAVLEAGIDLSTIVDLVESGNESDGGNLALLETIDGMSKAEQTAWYRANKEVKANLTRIWNGNTTGILKKDDVAFGYSVSSLLTGVLGIRDTNQDGVINDDDFTINLSFLSQVAGQADVSGYAITGATQLDDFGNIETFSGLEMFLGDWMAPKPAGTADASYGPDNINRFLAFILSVMDDGVEGILELLSKMGDTTFDPNLIRDNFDYIATVINFYWYDDGIDNDGDGRVDEETINGLDDDHDGLFDEDSNYHPADPNPNDNAGYTGVFYRWQNRVR